MGTRLLYGLKTDDASWLRQFYPARRLFEAAAKLGLDFDAMILPPWADPRPVVKACSGHTALLRGELSTDIYRMLEDARIPCVNPACAHALARDKAASAVFFRSIGARHPSTALIMSPSDALLPFPFVAKPRYGKMGRGVALIENLGRWSEWLGEHASEDGVIIQEFLPSTEGRDLRFFFAAWEGTGNPVCVRRQGGGFLSNAHAGAIMDRYTPPDWLDTEARRIFLQSKLVYGTVDFLFEADGGFSVCELNSCPGFEELERATGLDAASAILRSVLGLA
ncbi:MAG: hypothetical protein JW923_01080 [Spirochaetales bacterium]|nr:hypothetical protein [Spirochaetales bacterium]